MTGCATISDKPVETICSEDKLKELLSDSKKRQLELIKFNKDVASPPLDLSEFKDIEAKFISLAEGNYVAFTPEEYGRLLVLLEILSNKIREQEKQLDDILKFYEQQLDR